MRLEKIITLANKKTSILFYAMERSLRAQGCDLPIHIIPFDKNKFKLPSNAHWLENNELYAYLEKNFCKPVHRKYACLLESNYQYIDTDCIFLKNPMKALESHTGFVTCCCHWHNPGDTQTKATENIFKQKTTTWQRLVFNSGQFACDRSLYTIKDLIEITQNPSYIKDTLKNPFHEQPGFNLLVLLKSPPYTNITLPPYCVESSWAGDYPSGDFHFWKSENQKPYIIHWAGAKADGSHSVDALLFEYLTEAEKKLYIDAFVESRKSSYFKQLIMRLRRSYKTFKNIDGL